MIRARRRLTRLSRRLRVLNGWPETKKNAPARRGQGINGRSPVWGSLCRMSLPVLHPVLWMEEEQGIPDRTPDDHSPDRHEDPVDWTGLREPLEELSHPSLGCQKQRPGGEHEDGKAHHADREYEFHCVAPLYPVPP